MILVIFGVSSRIDAALPFNDIWIFVGKKIIKRHHAIPLENYELPMGYIFWGSCWKCMHYGILILKFLLYTLMVLYCKVSVLHIMGCLLWSFCCKYYGITTVIITMYSVPICVVGDNRDETINSAAFVYKMPPKYVVSDKYIK